MDYRKKADFGTNWSPERYRVLPYFAPEKEAVQNATRILDLGCANGWNMSRFRQYGHDNLVGIDYNAETIRHAVEYGAIAQASGLELPFRDNSFDLVYVQHVLHHIGTLGQSLREIERVLSSDGIFFLIETVEDNLGIKLGRDLYPSWLGDEINMRFSFSELKTAVSERFTITESGQYSTLFWAWEILPDQIPAMEKYTPHAVKLEEIASSLFPNTGAHVFIVAKSLTTTH